MVFYVQVYEYEGRVYMVMDFLSGGELFDKIARQRFFSEKEASGALEVLCRTLEILHKQQVTRLSLTILLILRHMWHFWYQYKNAKNLEFLYPKVIIWVL